nr:hypothetical protein CFP56_22285 [Quercus suber]
MHVRHKPDHTFEADHVISADNILHQSPAVGANLTSHWPTRAAFTLTFILLQHHNFLYRLPSVLSRDVTITMYVAIHAAAASSSPSILLLDAKSCVDSGSRHVTSLRTKMPPKEQTFDFETMAIVLYAMGQSGLKLGTSHYKMMSDATGNQRGHDSFNHQFRAVKKRADEIAVQAGGALSKEGSITTKAVASGNGKKRSAKTITDEGGSDKAQDQASKKKSKIQVKSENEGDELDFETAASEGEHDGLLK